MKRRSSGKASGSEGMRREYRFDYRESRPNRFSSRMVAGSLAVVLDPDVASVFMSSESVNELLRSVISALPAQRKPKVTPKKRAV